MTGYEPIFIAQDWNRSSDREWTKVLAEVPLFAGLGRRELRKLVRQARFATFAPGDSVILTGAPADSFYVILGGEATIRGTRNARTLRTGDFFGELALLEDTARTATVVATGELHVMRVPRRAFRQLVEKNADVAFLLLREIGARLRRAERQPAAA